MKNQQKLRSASEIDLKSQFATFDGIATKGDNAIVKRIMPFQGFQVMLDYDLAELYGVETKQLKRQVKRNMRRFPSDFMIEISERDMKSLRCQFGTSNRGGDRYGACAFTEQGIAMLSSILRSDRAVDVNIRIMRAFVAMRRFVYYGVGPHGKLKFFRGCLRGGLALFVLRVQVRAQEYRHSCSRTFARRRAGLRSWLSRVFWRDRV